MGHLLTAGVAGFQILILVTIIGSATTGRGWLYVTSIGWVLFTLFGSIFTAGLLLLQLLTIFIAYRIGSSIASNTKSDTSNARQPEPEASQPSAQTRDSSWLWIFALIVGVSMYFHNESTERTPSPQPVVQDPQRENIAPKPQSQPSERKEISKITTSHGSRADKDMRHCLNLPTDADIMRCANASR